MPYKSVAIALTAAIVGAMLATGAQTRWREVQIEWLGTIGVLPFGVAIVTLVFLAINSRHSARSVENTRATLEQSRRAEVATRFQKGVELLQSLSPATRIGGIAVLRDVATQSPEDYWPPVVEVLENLIHSGTRSMYDSLNEANDDARNADETGFPPHFGNTPDDVVGALEVLGLKNINLRLAVGNSGVLKRITIRYCALVNVQLTGLVFGHLSIERTFANNLYIVDSDCAGCYISMNAIDVNFHGCNIAGGALHFVESQWAPNSADLLECNLTGSGVVSGGTTMVRVKRCNVERALFNLSRGRMEDCWYIGRPFKRGDLFIERNNEWDAVDVTKAKPIRRSESGMDIYRDTPEDMMPF